MKDHGQNPDKGIKAGAAPVSFNEVEKLTEAKYTIQKYKRILCGDMCAACGIPFGKNSASLFFLFM